MGSIPIHSEAFYTLRFEDGFMVIEFQPHIHVDLKMYKQLYSELEKTRETIQKPFPLIIMVAGFMRMTNEARIWAKTKRGNGLTYATAVVSPNVAINAMIKLLLSLVGTADLDRAYFHDKEKAEKWLEEQRIRLGHAAITSKELS